MIAKAIAEKGAPNSAGVNRIMDYDLSHFSTYCKLVCDEMHARNCICKLENIIPKYLPEMEDVPYDKLFANWHNDRYLNQCYYALEEKSDEGTISKEDFEAIKKICYKISVEELKKLRAVKIESNTTKVSLDDLRKMLLAHPGESVTLKV